MRKKTKRSHHFIAVETYGIIFLLEWGQNNDKGVLIPELVLGKV